MPRIRVTSSHIKKADLRLNGMKAIQPDLDMGDGVSVASLTAARDQVATSMSAYNALLAQVAAKQNELQAFEKALAELNVKALSLAGARYGLDSTQYELVGGKRTSERKRRRPVG